MPTSALSRIGVRADVGIGPYGSVRRYRRVIARPVRKLAVAIRDPRLLVTGDWSLSSTNPNLAGRSPALRTYETESDPTQRRKTI